MENFERVINARGLRLKSDFLAPKIDAITTLSVSANEIFDSVLSRDLRSVASSKLSTLNVSSMRECSEPVLFQVISVVNIAQPCAKQMIPGLRPALLQLKLTDGQNKYVAIALEDIPKLSVSTVPGTKLFVKGCLIRKGKFLLLRENTQVIGGHVRELVEQWKMQKELRERKRACAADQEDPPPVFTDFEPAQKISQNRNGENSTSTKAFQVEASRPNASKHSSKKSTLISKKPPMMKKREKTDASKQSKRKSFKAKEAGSKIAQSQTKLAKKEEKKRINPNKPKQIPRGPKKTDSPAL